LDCNGCLFYFVRVIIVYLFAVGHNASVVPLHCIGSWSAALYARGKEQLLALCEHYEMDPLPKSKAARLLALAPKLGLGL
jgi:hypothetical protein